MRRRSNAVLALGIAALAASWAFGSRPLAPVGVGLILAATSARLWALAARGKVVLERLVGRPFYVEGDDVVLAYRLERATRLPLGAAYVRETIAGLGSFDTHVRGGQAQLGLRNVPRGRYPLSAAEVVLEEPLGLERVSVGFASGVDALVVVPRIVPLDRLFSEAGRDAFQGRRLLLRRPSGVDLHSVREYEHGESLRKVHWPTTARRGQLMVKELEDSPRDDLTVLVDCDAAAVAGPPGSSSFDAQVRAAGSLLHAYVGRGKRGSLVLGTRSSPVVRASSLDSDWPFVLQALAAVQPERDRPLARLLADERSAAIRAPELVVVSAAIDDSVVDRLVALAARRRLVSAVWVDAPSYAGKPGDHFSPALLRLAAAGVPLAVVREGMDLRVALGGAAERRASA
jgi:uncharacterized protein (DUF58 family)